MSVTIQDNFNTAAAKPTDARYGPYVSTAAAISAIDQAYRYLGLTVGIGTPAVEYWWASGVADLDLVIKTTNGNVQSVSAGTGINVTGAASTPTVAIDTAVVQVVSNKSIDVSADGTSDTKYPSVKAVKTYADGLIVGLLNDRGSYTPSATSGGPYPSSGGSGTLGAIMKGDIWFINGTGYLDTTSVTTGASVRALVDSPGQFTPADWDILDAGLGFIPENSANRVLNESGITANPSSTANYPSVKAMVDYITNHPPTVITPTLQQVTDVIGGNTTTKDVTLKSLFLTNSGSTPWNLTSSNNFTIADSSGTQRLNIPTTIGTIDINQSSSVAGTLDFNSLTTNQTYTFPDASGTLLIDTTGVPYTGATADVDLGTYDLTADVLYSTSGSIGHLYSTYIDVYDYILFTTNVSTNQTQIRYKNTGTTRTIYFPNADGDLIVSGTATNNYLTKWSNSGTTITNSLIYDSGTNIGIGTSSPTSKLHVSGTLGATALSVDGNINIQNGGAGTNTINGNINYLTAVNNKFYGYIDFANGSGQGNLLSLNADAPANDAQAWAPQQITGSVGRTSGTANNIMISITPTYNFTGSYAGTTRGIYYNPTITSLNGTTHTAFQNVTGDVLLGTTSGNVGIGTTSPDASAKVQIDSTSQGFLPPRMTYAEMNAIATPIVGLMVYVLSGGSDSDKIWVYRATQNPDTSGYWWPLDFKSYA